MSLIKIAAPRWFKFAKSNPNLFVKELLQTEAADSSMYGQRVIRSLKNKGINRKDFSKTIFSKAKEVEPINKEKYFKHKNKLFKTLVTNRELDSLKELHKGLGNLKSRLSDMLSGKKRNKVFLVPVKAVNSNRLVSVTHSSTSKINKTKSMRSPSALMHNGDNINTVYAFRSSSKKAQDVFANNSDSVKKYISKVRESDIVYAPNISSNKIGVELKIPSRSFIKGLRNESY